MKKIVTILALSLPLFLTANAQKADSVLLNIKSYGEEGREGGTILATKDGADFLLKIMSPPDNGTGVKIYAIKEYYPNGRLRLTGTATVTTYDKYVSLKFAGSYADGHQKSQVNYSKNGKIESIRQFYPNGNLCYIENYSNEDKLNLIEYRDSTGRVFTVNGNGTWVKFDNTYKHIIEQGSVVNSLEDGNWTGFVNDSVKYAKLYHNGNFIPTTDTTGEVFFDIDNPPKYSSDPKVFYNFLQKNLYYPAVAREKQIQGKVYVTLVVEKDGSLTDVSALKGPEKSLNYEALRVIKLSSPWIPGIQNGMPVRVRYTIPVSFILGN